MAHDPKIVLVAMPWAAVGTPSLALGILAAICHETKTPVRTFHPCLRLGSMVGLEAYNCLYSTNSCLTWGEHLFACDLFGADALHSDSNLSVVDSLDGAPVLTPALLKHIRDELIPPFLDQIAEEVLRENPSVVGFTVTYNQLLSTLALAHRLKRARPDIQILAGGMRIGGEMGLECHRAFHNVLDHVFLGEAEESFREYLRRLGAGEATSRIPGVTYFEKGKVQLIPGRPLADLNRSPLPDYDDYFLEAERLRADGFNFTLDYLPFEASRGCWWREKSPCIFCAHLEESKRYREKHVDRVLSDITSLSSKYHVLKLFASDAIISRKSRGEIFKELKALDCGIECFFNTRSDLSKQELEWIRDGGAFCLQPGIESFSTELLRHMGKGTTRIRQVQFLRWATEYRIKVSWLLLAQFPGEQVEWYLDMLEFLPKIFHLQAPLCQSQAVLLNRFSPLFDNLERYAITEIRPLASHIDLFPPGLIDVKKVSYFFEFDSPMLVPAKQYWERLQEVSTEWVKLHRNFAPIYYYTIGPGFVYITDTRDSARAHARINREDKGVNPKPEVRYLYLEGIAKDILLLADSIQSIHSLKALLAPLYPSEVAAHAVEEAVEEMLEEELLMREGKLLLTLPVGSKARTTDDLHDIVFGRPQASQCKHAFVSLATGQT